MVLKRCGVNKKRKAEPNVSLEELSHLLASSTKNESMKKGSIEILLNYITPQSNPEFVMAVLDEIMEFVKLKKKGDFYFDLYQSLIQALVYSPLGVEFFLDSLASNYFKYIDVRYFTLMSVEKTCNTLDKRIISGKCTTEGDGLQVSLDHSINKILFILSHIPPLGDSDTDFEVWSNGFCSKEGNTQESPKCKERRGGQEEKDKSAKKRVKLKLKFTKAWMSFLKLPLSVEVYKEVLVKLPQAVIPYLSKPEMLCDFLTRSYDVGGVVSVMALSGVFVLMTQHGIEYPDFYQKLYSLLIPSVFMAKHRVKFFELLDVCLKSPLLPAYLAAAFAKKLSRLSLVVPPSGALVIIALVYNLLHRHPSINFLVHQESHGETYSADGNVVVASDIIGGKQGFDVFNDDESDPLKSNAMRSSLWEIDTLRHHYCCPVSRFVLSLENDLTVRDKTTEMKVSDFSSASYSTIFKEEMRRRVKLDRLAKTTPTPTSTSLFSESEFPGWTFNCEG
ncbi:nucleolar complex protein 4 homolog B-like isoform X2 [Chenopodium quinoa]|uniref:nucleolar complex protein 4 homolog B-like isoform X2 n=1 Tax=Chenopodium quinoa TaxID=63459 RepID=UPI000B799646|nr:nucleolar complex protein 4 homolog B-like isoform X2 [Chenopodium quinoa]